MSYPNAYCVKCGTHTDTQMKHTVLLQSNARALKGVCPQCASAVYKILPKDRAYLSKVPLTPAQQQHYPDAFCMKCQKHTPTRSAHLVTFDNGSRAVTGQCGACSSDVYRILSAAQADGSEASERQAEHPGEAKAVFAPVTSLASRAQSRPKKPLPRSPLATAMRQQTPSAIRRFSPTTAQTSRATNLGISLATFGVLLGIGLAVLMFCVR